MIESYACKLYLCSFYEHLSQRMQASLWRGARENPNPKAEVHLSDTFLTPFEEVQLSCEPWFLKS